jgi:hypothetical protein
MPPNIDSKSAIQRLTALWAFSECGIGGVMHLMKLPFTGLILGGLACIIVVLIARLSDNLQKDILSSLMVVCLIKLSVSPHTPFTAYIAVGFQGLIGMLIYQWFGLRLMSVLFVCIISMLESAMQKLLVLTLIFGNPLWDAVNSFGASVLKNFSVEQGYSASNLLIGLYLIIYTLSGICIALISNHLLNILNKSDRVAQYENLQQELIPATEKNKTKNAPFIKKAVILIATALLVSVILYSGNKVWINALYLLLRSLIVLFLLYKIISPSILFILHKWLLKKQSAAQLNLKLTTDLFPQIRSVAVFARQQSLKASGPFKIVVLIEALILGVIFYKK